MSSFVKILILLVILFGVDATKSCRNKPENLIVGGFATNIKHVPYQVGFYILHKTETRPRFRCGGSILSKDFVITATHCLMKTQNYKYMIRVGSSYFPHGGKMHKVEKTIPYPEPEGYVDIMLLKLEKPLKFGKGIQPIKLPHKNFIVKDNYFLMVSGWGDTKSDEPRYRLRAALVPAFNQELCKEIFDNRKIAHLSHLFPSENWDVITNNITKSHICAGYNSN